MSARCVRLSLVCALCAVGVGVRDARAQAPGTITTVAGNGATFFSGDGAAATRAGIQYAYGVAIAPDGTFYIADGNTRVRKVNPAGIISTAAGNGVFGFTGDGGQARLAGLQGPTGVALDPAGNLYIADSMNHRVRKVDTAGVITTVAGTGNDAFSGDGGPATAADVRYPSGLVFRNGHLYFVDSGNYRVRKIDPQGIITTIAGNGSALTSGDNGSAITAGIGFLYTIAMDADGDIYFGSVAAQAVRRIDGNGIIRRFAGTGTAGFSGDGGPATAAALNNPLSVAVDGAGNVFVGDGANYRIRRIDTNGVISTIAGNGLSGWSGDGGPAAGSPIGMPIDLRFDTYGNLFIAANGAAHVRLIYGAGVPVPADSTAPALTCPGTTTVPASGSAALVSLDVTVGEDTWSLRSNVAGLSIARLNATTFRASGMFGIGTTALQFTAADDAGNGAVCAVAVVVDNTPLVGAMGPQGEPGPRGVAGPAGATGPAGADGAEGPAGATGPAGPSGPAGPTGPSGPSGPAGVAGAIGPAGPAGTAGAQGSRGDAGPQGVQGPQGIQGPAGPITQGSIVLIPVNRRTDTAPPPPAGYAFIGFTELEVPRARGGTNRGRDGDDEERRVKVAIYAKN